MHAATRALKNLETCRRALLSLAAAASHQNLQMQDIPCSSQQEERRGKKAADTGDTYKDSYCLKLLDSHITQIIETWLCLDTTSKFYQPCARARSISINPQPSASVRTHGEPKMAHKSFIIHSKENHKGKR